MNPPQAPAAPLLSVANLTKIYRRGELNERTVLNKINLSLYEGEFVILYGQSGSGKSLLLKIMAGFEKPDNGEVVFAGESLTKKKSNALARYRREGVGLVIPDFPLLPHLTIEQNVALPYVFGRKSTTDRLSQARTLLHEVGLDVYNTQYPVELSGGQLQKAAIARALIYEPRLILVDEPTYNLDTASAREVMALFSDINRRFHTTIFMITQNPDHVYYPNRVLYLKDGVISKEVINRPTAQTSQIPVASIATAQIPERAVSR